METPLEYLLQDVRQSLRDLYGGRLSEIVLYGSQARSEAGPDSDVDLLVVLDAPFDVITELRRLAPLQQALLGRYGMMVSIQPYTRDEYLNQENAFLSNVREDAVIV